MIFMTLLTAIRTCESPGMWNLIGHVPHTHTHTHSSADCAVPARSARYVIYVYSGVCYRMSTDHRHLFQWVITSRWPTARRAGRCLLSIGHASATQLLFSVAIGRSADCWLYDWTGDRLMSKRQCAKNDRSGHAVVARCSTRPWTPI